MANGRSGENQAFCPGDHLAHIDYLVEVIVWVITGACLSVLACQLIGIWPRHYTGYRCAEIAILEHLGWVLVMVQGVVLAGNQIGPLSNFGKICGQIYCEIRA